MTKQELNKKLADLYGLHEAEMYEDNLVHLIDDSSRMFELMIDNKIAFELSGLFYISGVEQEYVAARKIGVWPNRVIAFLKDHETPQAAARFAIALALVKLAESKS